VINEDLAKGNKLHKLLAQDPEGNDEVKITA